MITTSELIRQVRAQIQEDNKQGPVTTEVILDALNRGLDYGWDILARNYYPPVLGKTEELTLDADGKFELPTGMLEDRVLKIDLITGSGSHQELQAVSHQQTTSLANKGLGGQPTAYTLMGRTVQVWPSAAAGGRKVIMWYLKAPPKIVAQQGRITSFSPQGTDPVTNAVVVVDSLSGTDLAVSGDFKKYFNFVNFETGEIRGSAQIQSINGEQITLKLTPTRSKVLDRAIDGDLPTDLQVDDFICGIDGSCVLYFSKPLSGMVIQYAVAEIRRSLGYDIGVEERKLKDLENQVSYTFSKRPSILKVKRRNNIWKPRYFDNGVN